VRDFGTRATSLAEHFAVADDEDSAAAALASQVRCHLDQYGAEADEDIPCLPYSDFVFMIAVNPVAGRLVPDGNWREHGSFYRAEFTDSRSAVS